jgi:glycosyltransferase involved in cell wall biosynthesis
VTLMVELVNANHAAVPSCPACHASAMRHSFVVPAYGFSPHLAECLASLRAQTLAISEVVVVTSTPTPELHALVDSLGLPLFVHEGRGIAQDWNAALDHASGDWVTLAHQDDVYHPGFCEHTLQGLAHAEDALIAFTDYEELTPSGPRERSTLLKIKRVLLELGFLGRSVVRTRLARTNALRFGCAIPCPAVTMRRDAHVRFDPTFGVNLDWAAWLDLCERPGSFVWVREVLMAHRIHGESETTQAIAAGRRADEDARLLRRLWPAWIARMIVRSYGLAYASNKT